MAGGYERHVGRVFSQVRGARTRRERVALEDVRVVVFSDHHRGDRSRSDDFVRCEETYHAALDWYLGDGFKLVLLGDVEELWEALPGEVVSNYGATLALEREFAKTGRYARLWGNHDDAWAHAGEVKKHLGDYVCGADGCLLVDEAVEMEVRDGGERLGSFFLTHGHQGTLDSDRLAGLSRWVVRWLWRPVQRLFGVTLDTPAHDLRLRLKHELAMHAWASGQEGLVLVTGHTHHAVFCSQSHASQLKNEIERAESRGEDAAEKRVELAALLEREGGEMVIRDEDVRPCYFNTGCCCFSDGDITGLELADGEVRLVKWSPGGQREVLRSADLREVFRQVGTAG